MARYFVTQACRLTVVVVVAGLAQVIPADSAPAWTAGAQLQPQFEKPKSFRSVPVHKVRPGPRRNLGMPTSPRPRAAVDWPEGAVSVLPIGRGSQTRGGTATAPELVEIGSLPVSVEQEQRAPRTSVRIRVHSHSEAIKQGVPGVLLSLTSVVGTQELAPTRLTIDYSAFNGAYGAGWASRLQAVPLDEAQGAARTLRNDLDKHVLTALVDPAGATGTFALSAATTGSTGDFKATPLQSSGRWQADLNSGGFSWEYPLRVPPAAGGLEPDLSLSYSSQSVDGRVVAQNNQPSWVGEGWDLWPGYIERSYKPCATDLGGTNGQTKTGDLCWETENATAVGLAATGALVKAGDNKWRPEKDDGTRVEHVTGATNGDDNGEHWILTKPDGTKYYFGLNRLPGWAPGNRPTNSAWTVPVFGNDSGEPCFASNFQEAACTQAYRWNLDYVVDVHGNSMSYFYSQETNKYGQNLGKTTATYVRGGVLAEVHYGTRTGHDYDEVPAKVVLEPGDRCVPGKDCAQHTSASWPDVPWDLDCTGQTCSTAQYSPSFWTTKRLSRITTEILHADGNPRQVDQWTVSHTWPDPGDGTNAGLWLNQVRQKGLAKPTALELPPITFTGTMKPNRVNTATDGLPKMNKPRLTAIDTETGGRISAVYAPTDCTAGALPAAESNTKRCFPVRWAMPPVTEPDDDWFNKYVVAQVNEMDNLTEASTHVTRYDYVGGAAWAWNDDPLVDIKERSWSDWRGYEQVVVRHGDPAQDPDSKLLKSQQQFFRGMDGDRLNRAGGTEPRKITNSAGAESDDLPEYAGFQHEQINYLGDTETEVSGAISTPWSRLTATQTVLGTTLKAHQVEQSRSVARVRLGSGADRSVRTDRTYDTHGNVTEIDAHGDTAVTGDEHCTTNDYALNTGINLVNLSRHSVVETGPCQAGDPAVAAIEAESRTFYDGHDLLDPPTRGLSTRTQTVKSYTGGTPAYVTTSAAYDHYGRNTSQTDSLSRTTTSEYEQTKGLTTATVVTNPLQHVTRTTVDPAWGADTKSLDPNERVTTKNYDALGRIVSVFLPGRTSADGSPNVRFGYGLRTSGGPNWVSTETLMANGNTTTRYELFDGLLRPRQTQQDSPTSAGGRTLTNTTYDSRGLVVRTDESYYNDAAPDTAFYKPDAGAVPSSTVTVYDGAGRPTDSLQIANNDEKWRTTTRYSGDSVTVIPPSGGIVTKSVTNAQGRTTSRLQYHDRSATGDPDATTYQYTRRGELRTVTDPAGNVWRYDYDFLGRKIETDDPDSGMATATYDDAGQVLTTTDARGQTIATSYDKLGRVTETRLGSETGTMLSQFAYDTLSGGKGVLTSATRFDNGNAYVTATDELDAAGRPMATSVTIPTVSGMQALAGTYTTTYAYKTEGSLASRRLPQLGDLAAETVSTTYNSFGMPNRLVGATTYVDSTAYTELGDVSNMRLGPKPTAGQVSQQLTRWMTYDPTTRRVTSQQLTRVLDGSTTAHKLAYDYDPAGNVTKIVDHAAGYVADTQCYHYDYLRRVTEVWTQVTGCADTASDATIGGPAPYWQTYAYDVAGNRTHMTNKGIAGAAARTTTYDYPAPGADAQQPHTVTSTTTTHGSSSSTSSYGYDESGHTETRPNPTGDPQQLVWAESGELAEVRTGEKVTSYIYDANGAVLLRRDPDQITLYVSDGELALNTTTGLAKGRRHYPGIGTRTKAEGLTYLAGDQHGTSQVAVKATDRTAMDVRRMDLFGNPRTGSPTWRGGPRGFVNGSLNPDTGLARLGAREYDAQLGRFLSVDAVFDPSDPQQMNGYAYANNSPATASDPSGLFYILGDVQRPKTTSPTCVLDSSKCGGRARSPWRSNRWDSGAARSRARRSCQFNAIACATKRIAENRRLRGIAARNATLARQRVKDPKFNAATPKSQPVELPELPAALQAHKNAKLASAAEDILGWVPPLAPLSVGLWAYGKSAAVDQQWASFGDPSTMAAVEGMKSTSWDAKFFGTDDLLDLEMPSATENNTDSYASWAREIANKKMPVWLTTKFDCRMLNNPIGWQANYVAMYNTFMDAGYVNAGNELLPPG